MRARRRRPTSFGSLFVAIPERAEEYGPYPDRAARNVLAFARIGSQRGGAREVWHCPKDRKKRCRRVRRYEEGRRVFPRRG